MNAGAVNLAIITRNEKLHVWIISDEGLVGRTCIRLGDSSREDKYKKQVERNVA